MKKTLLLFTTLFLFTLSPTLAQAVEVKSNTELIPDIVNQYIEDEQFAGATIIVGDANGIIYEEHFGNVQAYDMGEPVTDSAPITSNTLYDLASLTKVLSTTQAIMKLHYDGDIDINAPVKEYLPEFGENGKEEVLISDLLTHTSGLTPWYATYFYVTNRDEMIHYISDMPLEYETGTDRIYSDFSFITLGLVIEKITGQSLDEYVEREIYQPLEMSQTMYIPKEKLEASDTEFVATSWGNPYEYKMVDDDNFGYDVAEDAEDFENWRDYTLIGEVNDGNAFYSLEGVSGHAGLFSTGSDIAKLLQLMLNEGQSNSVTLYDQATIDKFTSIQSDFGHGYGWEINRGGEDEGYMGVEANENFFGHTGFTGTSIVVDKESGLYTIILTNKLNMGVDEEGNYPNSFTFYRDIMNQIYSE